MLAQGADSGGADPAGPDQAKTDSLYEDRPGSKKIIRVITVMAYMVSVSFVAIVLSGYYVFLWQPPNPRLLHHARLRADPQIEYRVDDKPVSRSMDITDHLDLRQQILRSRGINITDRINPDAGSRNINPIDNFDGSVSQRNKTFSNDTQTFSTTWNPIFQALLKTKSKTNVDVTTREPVYKSVNKVPMNNSDIVTSSVLFIQNDEINEVPNDRAAPTISSVLPKGNQFPEPSTTETTNESTLSHISKHVSNFEIDRDRDNFTKDPFATTSTILESSTKTYDINYRQMTITKPIEPSDNREISTTKYSTSGFESVHEFPEDQTTEKMESELKAQSKSIGQPNESGSHIARVPITRSAINDSLEEHKHEKNLPVQLSSRDPPVDSSTEDMEAVNELALGPPPLIVQPDPKFADEDKIEMKEERLSQEISDFDFV